MGSTIRIGAGAGYSGDRIEPAVELATYADLDYLCFECLAERTIALAQGVRARNPDGGYDPLLERRVRAVLPIAHAKGIRIVSNMGAANPLGAARAVRAIARDLGIAGLRVAAVVGDDVLDTILAANYPLLDRPGTTADLGGSIISANAYLGAFPIAQALSEGASVVLTGRVCDPSLFLGPIIHEFGWSADDYASLARGTMVGHLLECAGQLTGGYFADPGIKDVPNLARLGFPFADVGRDGLAVFGKLAQSGGQISIASCLEQLLYEVLDPGAYLQADVVADFRDVLFDQRGPDRIVASGARGLPRPDTLKVSVGYRDGFIGEGQISYAGPGAVARAELAVAIVRERLAITGVAVREIESELIGIDSVNRTAARGEPNEVRARIVARTGDREAAERIGAEVEALYTNGPAGGGGAVSSVREVIAVASTLIDRALVQPRIVHEEM